MARLAWTRKSQWCEESACGRYSISIVMPAIKGQRFIVTLWDARSKPREVLACWQHFDKFEALTGARRFCQDREDLKGVSR